ncbi:hypothetical protein SEA_JUMBO_65 [Gordonia phage Jumbo]|uniref:Uncharacterized protein n=1 Tax=Gordonia phage Jumbo TaxID=1887650 RepID=A0A1B3B0N1_9CAUD|nr:hypothetical protein BIZ69_gp065 [Gordonia phage Jumbo]AOE44573.1 hypothetical protein SEA_JUMBO_65 [Gordonia phage Jumbo]
MNRLGVNTHKLIAESLGGKVRLLATGPESFCLQKFREFLVEVADRKLVMKPGEKIYICKVDDELVIYGPDFDYQVLGRKQNNEPPKA